MPGAFEISFVKLINIFYYDFSELAAAPSEPLLPTAMPYSITLTQFKTIAMNAKKPTLLKHRLYHSFAYPSVLLQIYYSQESSQNPSPFINPTLLSSLPQHTTSSALL